MEIIIAFFLGVLSSLTIWILTTQVFVPKVEFSDQICRYSVEDINSSGYKLSSYEFKICNIGKREIFDIDVSFKIYIKGLISSDIYEHFTIPVGTNNGKISILKPTKPISKGLAMSIHPNELNLLERKYFPKYILEKFKDKQLTLDDLYHLGTHVYSEIVLFGYDNLSGTKKHFCSKKYRIKDLVNGQFELNSMKINPSNIEFVDEYR